MMKLACAAAVLSIAIPAAYAGQQVAPPGKESKAVIFDPFEKGNKEFQAGLGMYFSLNSGGEKRPTLNDLDLNLRLGWMLTSPAGDGAFRGNFELLGELFGAAVVEGPGDVILGGTVLLRYNFVQPDSKFVPYFQIGVGGVYNDIYKSHPQRLVGQSFEFNLQAGFGARYFFNEHLAGFVEGGYRHLSNADNSDRNLGLNSLGFQLGVSYFW